MVGIDVVIDVVMLLLLLSWLLSHRIWEHKGCTFLLVFCTSCLIQAQSHPLSPDHQSPVVSLLATEPSWKAFCFECNSSELRWLEAQPFGALNYLGSQPGIHFELHFSI